MPRARQPIGCSDRVDKEGLSGLVAIATHARGGEYTADGEQETEPEIDVEECRAHVHSIEDFRDGDDLATSN